MPTTYCEQIVVHGLREYMGGCRYLYPVGKCAQNHAYNKGCAQVAQEWAYTRVASYASLTLNLVAINVISTFIACCLCFKRRDEDVLPPEYTKAMAGVWIEESKIVSHAEKPYLVEPRCTSQHVQLEIPKRRRRVAVPLTRFGLFFRQIRRNSRRFRVHEQHRQVIYTIF